MKKSGVIEINGRRYSAHDGSQLDAPKSESTETTVHTEKSKSAQRSRQKAPFAKRRPQNRSQLLMRQAVRPPETYVRITYRSQGELEPEVSIETNLPMDRIVRRANHASNVHKSQSIKHFDGYAVSHYANIADVRPQPTPQPALNDFKVSTPRGSGPLKQPRTSADVLEMAMANLYEPVEVPPKTSFFRLRRRDKHLVR